MVLISLQQYYEKYIETRTELSNFVHKIINSTPNAPIIFGVTNYDEYLKNESIWNKQFCEMHKINNDNNDLLLDNHLLKNALFPLQKQFSNVDNEVFFLGSTSSDHWANINELIQKCVQLSLELRKSRIILQQRKNKAIENNSKIGGIRDKIFDLVAAIISIADISTDVLITYSFFGTKMVPFIIACIIFGCAQVCLFI